MRIYRSLPIIPVVLSILLIPVFASGDQLDHTVQFRESDLRFSTFEGYDKILLEGSDMAFTPGEPELPVHLLHLALPGGAVVDGVELVDDRWATLSGHFTIQPNQHPFVLSHDQLNIPMPEPVAPMKEIYNANIPYPAGAAEFTGSGYMAGIHIAGFQIHPLRYRPLSGSLELCEKATVRVTYHVEASGHRFETFENRDGKAMTRVAERLVDNPLDLCNLNVKKIEPAVRQRDGEEYDYLLICIADQADEYAPLMEWKERKGYKVKTITVEEIDSTYSAIDSTFARIRQCVIDEYANWGISYLLLGGDPDRVPARTAWALSTGMPGPSDNLRADLYFADLDGTWNLDGDLIYGEVEDSVDLYADIIVGRFSARRPAQVIDMVNKQLVYERTPPTDYQTEMLFTGEILWSDPLTDSKIGVNYIDETCMPPRFDPIEKLYQSDGNESYWSVMNALNDGQNFWLHDGHGNTDLMSVGSGVLRGDDMADLTNGPRFTICYSIACLAASFGSIECIAERFVRNGDGGGVAFIGNDSYGWGSPGNPKFGYSDRLQHRFFYQMFHDDVYGLGSNLALVKAHYVPQSRSANVYRWHQYSVNLLGEPEFMAWTDTPVSMDVSHPMAWPMAAGDFTVTVTDGGVPLENALVCVTNDGDVHKAALTDASGQVALPVFPSTADSFFVTVTAFDHLPYEGAIPVLPSGPYATVDTYDLDDSAGDGNGLLNADESVDLAFTLRNPGTETALSVTALLRSTDPLVTITDSTDSFGDIPADASVAGAGGFSFALDSSAPLGHACHFDLVISASSGGPWEDVISISVSAPLLRLADLGVGDAVGGNGNYRIDPDETFDMAASFRNDGDDTAAGALVELSIASAYFTYDDSVFETGDIVAGDRRSALFEVTALPGCPDPHFATAYFGITTTNGYSFSDSTILVVGSTGFDDDLESGEGNWTHSGAGDLWHLSSGRTHSGSNAWYAGRQDTSLYNPDMEAILESPVVTLDPDPHLSFWLWHELPVFGADGVYVIVTESAVHDTIDWIASGGALGIYTIGNDWLEFSYNLAYYGYEAGDDVRVAFVFKSDDDDDIAEGCYVDDIVLTGTMPMATGVKESSDAPNRTALLGNVPNPFNPQTTVRFTTARSGPAHLAVYDLSGRLVRTLTHGTLDAGLHEVVWDGRNDSGFGVSSGIYFSRLSADGKTFSSKLVLLK